MSDIAHGLALALVAGEWTIESLCERGRSALGQKPGWLKSLARRVLARFPDRPPDPETLEEVLWGDDQLWDALARSGPPATIRRWFTPEPTMAPVDGPPAGFMVPPITTQAELATRLEISGAELEWFADLRQLNARARERLRHYAYRWVPKRSVGHRLLETPKRRIKAIHRRLLGEVLAAIPPSPEAHGFVGGRSVHSFVAPHVGKRVVIRLDLQNFFTAVTRSRIAAVFRRVGYPRSVASRLASLCTTAPPEEVLQRCPRSSRRFETISRLRCPHLPQGAPTSPALSNLAAFVLDRRLAGLAASAGASYTRYADDLAFSGGSELSRDATAFVHLVGAIVLDEGFEVNYRKTRVMRSGRRQQVGGLVVNRRPNVKRRDYDALRALLHNAARFGPESQNRHRHPEFRAHLAGRIAWVAASNPRRGEKLARLLAAIEW